MVTFILFCSEELQLALAAFRSGQPVIYPNWTNRSSLGIYVGVLLALFVSIETVSLCLAAAIIRYLRRNSTSFTTQTYRLQMQLIVLLIIQVGYHICI